MPAIYAIIIFVLVFALLNILQSGRID